MEDWQEEGTEESYSARDDIQGIAHAIRYMQAHDHAEKPILTPSSFPSVDKTQGWTALSSNSCHKHRSIVSICNSGNEKQLYESEWGTMDPTKEMEIHPAAISPAHPSLCSSQRENTQHSLLRLERVFFGHFSLYRY